MNKAKLTTKLVNRGKRPFEISITNLGILLTEKLRAAVEQKIGRVRQYAPDAIRAVVDVQKTANKKSPKQFRVFVRYEIPGYDLTAEHRAHEPLTAIDLVAEKIERRLRKRKTAFLAGRLGRHGRPVRITDFCVPLPQAPAQGLSAGATI